jgi:nicotinate-nucleotide--dimethylbenzimidazole phosphoribosyltransferase
MLRFASCVQSGALRTIFPAALFIVVDMADRSAARIPSRQASLRQEEVAVPVAQPEAAVAEAAVPVAQPEAAVAEAAVPVAQPEAAAAEAAVPVAQPEVAAAEAAVPVAQPEAAVAEAAVPVAQPEVAAAEAAVPVARREAAVPASQPEVAEAAVPASQQEEVAAEAAVVPVAQQEAASPVAPPVEVALVWPAAVLEPPVVLTMAVQAAPPDPARVPAVVGSEMGSVRCRETAAVVASAPQLRAVAAHYRSGLAMGLGRPSSRPARSRLVSGSPSAASAAAAADLQSRQAAAVRSAFPGWAWLRRPAPQEPVAMPSHLASEKATSKAESETPRVCQVWRLEVKELQVLASACRRQLAQLRPAVQERVATSAH